MSAAIVLGAAVVLFTYVHHGNKRDKALADAERAAERRATRNPRGRRSRRQERGGRYERGDSRWNR